MCKEYMNEHAVAENDNRVRELLKLHYDFQKICTVSKYLQLKVVSPRIASQGHEKSDAMSMQQLRCRPPSFLAFLKIPSHPILCYRSRTKMRQGVLVSVRCRDKVVAVERGRWWRQDERR